MSQVSALKSSRTKLRISLRVKTILTILLTVICVFLAITFIVDPIIESSFTREEFMAMDINDFIAPENAPLVEPHIAETLEKGENTTETL